MTIKISRLVMIGFYLPSLSLMSVVSNIFVQPRLEWLFCILTTKIKRHWGLISLFLITVIYLPIGVWLSDGFVGALEYLALPLSYLFVIMFVSNRYLLNNMDSFFKYSIVLNAVYVVYQFLAWKLGHVDMAMLHTNLAGQVNYIMHWDSYFYRYSGLFNENSPFVFYLSICFVYFVWVKSNLKYLALLLILFSGSKLGYLFLLVYLASRYRTLFLPLGASFVYIAYYYWESIPIPKSSLYQRYDELIESITNLTWLGSGDISGLNIISYLFGGYGLIIGASIVLFHLVTFNRSSKAKDLIVLFVVGASASGSLVILQHSLLLILAVMNFEPNSYSLKYRGSTA